jgi:hypothetical protein
MSLELKKIDTPDFLEKASKGKQVYFTPVNEADKDEESGVDLSLYELIGYSDKGTFFVKQEIKPLTKKGKKHVKGNSN